jgi:hypothetical protein
MDEDDYYYEEENTETKADFQTQERVNMRNDIDIDMYINTPQNKAFMSKNEKFVKSVYAISLDIMNNTKLIFKGDLEIILGNINNLNKPEHKNATGFVLGYIVTNGGKMIDKERLKNVFKLLNYKKGPGKYVMEDDSVFEADVIRYSRLWLTLS